MKTAPHNSIKTRFAIKFVQAMKKLNNKTPPSSSPTTKFRAVRAAAASSMASAVGPTRAWTRALLKKTRNHNSHHMVIRRKRRGGLIMRRKKTVRRRNPRSEFGQEDDLRCLVPGGRGMEFHSLLSETAHYIKCLKAQVQVMTNILDHYST